MKSCPDPKCNAPTLQCRMGEDSPANCQIWAKGGSGAVQDRRQDDATDVARAPWSGAALGTAGLGFLTARGEPSLVAVIGPHNAGKTTLLGMFYQQLFRSGRIDQSRFAGSYSLEGWEAVAHALRWDGATPCFPHHTSSGGGRTPGLLHLALRDQADRLSDVLFADSPGEWFQRWSITPAAGDAEGARWVVERAANLIIVADCEALSGPARGPARNDITQLLRRVANERRGRPVALAWTKADRAVPAAIEKAVTDVACLVMPDIATFFTSVVPFQLDGRSVAPGDAVRELLEWSVSRAPRGVRIPSDPPTTDDPFFMIGARR